MNIIRQAARGLNRLLQRGGGAIYQDGELVFQPLPSETAILQSLAASGGMKRWRNIPTITSNRVTDVRYSQRSNTPPTSRAGGALTTERERVLIVPPRRTLQQTRRLRSTNAAADDTRRTERTASYNIGHINARSLPRRMDEVNILLDDHRLDVLCISETWLREDVTDRVLVFPGYHISRCDRSAPAAARSTPRGGGVAILAREDLRVNKLAIGGADTAVESLWLSVTGAGRQAVVVGALYRPPAAPAGRGLELIELQLRAAVSTGKPVVAMGDYNINMMNTEEPTSRRLQTVMSDLGLRQLVDQPTHLHPTPTLLDLAITNLTEVPVTSLVLPDAVADHQPILVKTQLGRRRRTRPPPVTSRSWSRVDWDALRLTLLMADWGQFQAAASVDDKLTAFMAVWSAAIDQHCPQTTVTRRRPDCPWLRDNPEIATAREDRDDARRTWTRNKTAETRLRYQQRRNNLKRVIISAKRQYLCDSLTTDRRQFWSRVRNFALRPSGGGPSDAEDVGERADAFNAHFASIGPRIAAEVGRDGGDTIGPRPPRVCASALTLRPATLPELWSAVARMSGSRAVGLDDVPLFAVKKCFPVIGPHLLHLINCSIVTEVFPTAWKVARVVPIFKSGDRTEVNNFRPISILSVLSKIAEKVVSIQLATYLLDHHILSPAQYAYRPNHCTEDAVLDAVDWISQKIDEGRVASLTAIDLSKAFDSVDHGVLLAKLGWYGVCSTDWFRSYLGERRQLVSGGSSTLPLSHGVAQGSILGPILFLIFMNDLSSSLPHGRLLSYADDTQLLDHSLPDLISISALRVRVEESMQHLQNWFKVNGLKMNPNKTDFALIGTRASLKNAQNFSIHISGSTITPSPTIKVLGVLLDQHLNWDAHVSLVVRRCNAVTASLFKVRHHLTPDALKLLVNAHVFPHVAYCLSVWGGASKCRLSRVQRSLNFAARLITGVRRCDHISPALASLGWDRVEGMVAKHDCANVCRALSSQRCPDALRAMFTKRSDVSSRSTRATNTGDLYVPKCKLAQSQKGFRHRAARTWNSLPPNVKVAPSKRALKSAMPISGAH